MIHLDIDHNVLSNPYQYVRTKHNGDKVLVFERGYVLFVFNFHCSQSFQEYPIYVRSCSKVKVLLSTDDKAFGGHERVSHQEYEVERVDEFCGKFKLYLPCRSAIALEILVPAAIGE